MEIYLLCAPLVASLFLNLYQHRKLKQLKSKRSMTVPAQELLHRILGGRAVLDIKVIDPGNFMLISKEWD